MADIFISYAKEDQSQARLLAALLEAQGYTVWCNSHDRKAIRRRLRGSQSNYGISSLPGSVRQAGAHALYQPRCARTALRVGEMDR
jgi:hypothetical protein